MGREENVVVFRDTERKVKEIPALRDAVKQSIQKQVFISERTKVAEVMPELNNNKDHYSTDAAVVVSKKRTYEAASAYAGEKVCVLNFASATNPGGGVVKGSNAQEESLCRCSTLYFNLNTQKMWDEFYTPHRNEQNPIHNDDCIYTPDVVVFKTDTAVPETLPEREWYRVNVVTCAAPNLRERPSNLMNSGDGNKRAILSDEELYALHVKRLTRILDVAVAGGNEVIILGAFENNPEVVVKASKKVIEAYKRSFKKIEFAVYCSPRDEKNYRVFRREMEE